MSALKHCSRLARIATRKTKYYGLQQIRPISVAPSVIFRNITHQKTFVNGYAQWNPNIVKSRIPDIPLPKVTFTDQVWTKVDRWSDHTALVCGVTGKEVKYSEVRNDCRKFGVALLKELGLKPGEVIATILPNTIEYPSILFGAIEAGIIVTTINPAYTADEIAFQIKDSGAKLAVTFSQKVNTLLEVKEKFGLPDLEIVSTGKDLPENVKSYQNLLSNANPDLLKDLKPKKFSSDDTIVIPYSSGTTGKPKGVCLTHQNLISNLVSMEQVGHFQDTSANYQEVIPVVLPMFHIYGMTVVVGQAMSRGAKLIMIPKFDEEMFLRSLKDYKATVLYVAPPLVLYIGNSPKVTKDHLKTLKTILSGAAPVGELDIEKCLKKSPESVEYMQGYGLTETSPAVCSMIHGYKIYSSVGPPVVNTLVKIIDIQTQQALGNNEEGEICVKGPQVMKCYLNNKEATDGVLKDGWFHTGDIGYYDTEGFFYVTDRVKELIKVKGFQVAPAELESVLRSHPDVADAGVIGAPHERHGETPVAFVQIRSGKADEKALKDYLKDKLAKYKQIEKFIFVDSIPKSAAGKILRKELRVQYQNMTKGRIQRRFLVVT